MNPNTLLPEQLPYVPEAEVTVDSSPEKIGTQYINLKDQSGPKTGLD